MSLKNNEESKKDSVPQPTQFKDDYGDVKEDDIPSKIELLKAMEIYSKELTQSKIFERIIPRAFNEESDIDSFCSNIQYSKNENDLNSLTQAVSDPIWDILDRGGKRWRPILFILILEAFGFDYKEYLEGAALTEIIHNGSLIVDDIEDDTQMRRNKKCVHLNHGVDVSINAGNLMYFAPMNALIKSLQEKPDFPKERLINIVQIYTEEMTNVHVGQAWDIFWHNRNRTDKVPSEKQYLQMTALKTGCLSRMAARIAGEIVGLPKDIAKRFADFTERIGIAFQIQDDILNLVGEKYVSTKGMYGEDIYEGKMSLIVIHSMMKSSESDSKRLLEILKMRTKDENLINEAIELMKKTDSLKYADTKAVELIESAWNEVVNYIPNNKFKFYLKALANFFITREK